MTRQRVVCPHNGRHLPVTFWYPTETPETRKREGLFDLSAAFDAPPAAGAFGLLGLSHGSGGSDLNHHDWAEALARAGFVVAAPRHVGDSHDYRAGIGSKEQLLERPRQLRVAMESALEAAELGRNIDRSRRGVMGFSAGAYTALVVAGGRPNFTRWERHCHRTPEAGVLCPAGQAPRVPEMLPGDWLGVADAGIVAAVLLAPFAMLFDAAGTADVTAAVRLYRAADDTVTHNDSHADHLAGILPRRPEVATVPGDHYVFISPVAEDIARRYPLYYADAPGVDRPAIHRHIATEIAAYFTKTIA